MLSTCLHECPATSPRRVCWPRQRERNFRSVGRRWTRGWPWRRGSLPRPGPGGGASCPGVQVAGAGGRAGYPGARRLWTQTRLARVPPWTPRSRYDLRCRLIVVQARLQPSVSDLNLRMTVEEPAQGWELSDPELLTCQLVKASHMSANQGFSLVSHSKLITCRPINASHMSANQGFSHVSQSRLLTCWPIKASHMSANQGFSHVSQSRLLTCPPIKASY